MAAKQLGLFEMYFHLRVNQFTFSHENSQHPRKFGSPSGDRRGGKGEGRSWALAYYL